jgi:HEAT repeat protein
MRFFQWLFNDPPDTYELMRQQDVDSVIAALNHSLSWVRRDAVLTLGATNDRQYQALLTTALNDPDADVRQAAQAALATLGDTEAFEARLLQAVADSPYAEQPN